MVSVHKKIYAVMFLCLTSFPMVASITRIAVKKERGEVFLELSSGYDAQSKRAGVLGWLRDQSGMIVFGAACLGLWLSMRRKEKPRELLPCTIDNSNIVAARATLDKYHDGQDKVKERVLDFLAANKFRTSNTSTILCFYGPPGVGKTSIGKAVAECMGRKFGRIALGGVKEAGELVGHNSVYVGSGAGKIYKVFSGSGSCNPVIMLDEIDKLGRSITQGDPYAVLLEALDSEQNQKFRDHYLDEEIDLSKVLFIATANDLEVIPKSLRDRMEIIEFSSYSVEEKLTIAKNRIVPKVVKRAGLDSKGIEFSDEVLLKIIENYTLEAGVRDLERKIGRLCEKFARALVDNSGAVSFTCDNLNNYLGPQLIVRDQHTHLGKVGLSNGLVWTQCGGKIMPVEAVFMQGAGKLRLSGSLGDVLKESAQAAVSYVRANAPSLGVNAVKFKNYDLHIHIPDGATPKDGPSGGVAITVATLSAATGRSVRGDFAMTGEIDLHGNVLPVGGIREKVLGASRIGIKNIILPKDNEQDFQEVASLVSGIKVYFVDTFEQVRNIVFE